MTTTERLPEGLVIRGCGSDKPALHLLTALQEGVSSKKNDWTLSLKLPFSARLSVFMLPSKPRYKENSGLDNEQ